MDSLILSFLPDKNNEFQKLDDYSYTHHIDIEDELNSSRASFSYFGDFSYLACQF